MGERTCSKHECGRKVHARGVCKLHYLRALKEGAFTPSKPSGPTHSITNADLRKGVGDCAVCGPETPIRVRPGRGHECKVRRKNDNLKRTKKSRLQTRIRKYSLTLEDIEQMRANQGGRCAICQSPAGRLVIDHDHACCPKTRTSCGKCVRGLLCDRCNIALGYWRDDPQVVIAAAEYLLK